MANFEALKTLIRQYIKENGDGEITGDILQSVLIAMVTEVEGNGYVYAGIATPTTEPVTGNVFYIATEAGSYSNFGSVDVSAGITILKRDGSSWTKNQISYTDGVFDISAYNGSSYANLTAALGTNGANVPLAVRKGGMSVKFVNTSDNNKYVQYRYMSSSTAVADFTNVANWQGVDDEPTAGSNNLITSGGVFPLNLAINGGTITVELTEVTTVNGVGIASGSSFITSQGRENYSVKTYLLELGKTYHVRVPKLTDRYTFVKGFISSSDAMNPTGKYISNGGDTGPKTNYEFDTTAPSSELLCLVVCYQTAYGTPTVTTQQYVAGLTDKVVNLATQVGYYECDTAEGTAAKTITVANYNLFAGGSMKVKFVNKNTANNATLNINSQGAKALYYQGERVSSTNSWNEGEVTEIYYDGTSYYANNVKGGSDSGVYDVSVEHPNSGPNGDGKFTLEYILNSNNVSELIPVNKRYHGMSIQFISTIDNKYVQFRYLLEYSNTTAGNAAFINIANWQGTDSELKDNSDNLITNRPVAKEIDNINGSFNRNEDGSFNVTDKEGNIGIKYDTNGFDVAKISNHFNKDLAFNQKEITGYDYDKDEDFIVCDKDGYIIFYANARGINYIGKQSDNQKVDDGYKQSDIVYNMYYGRSLSYHGQCTPQDDRYTTLAFKLSSYGNPESMLLNVTSDIVDNQAAMDALFLGFRKAPASKNIIVANRALCMFLNQENGINLAWKDEETLDPEYQYQFVGCNPGEVATYSQLADSNGLYYKRLLKSVEYAKKFADEMGKTFSVGCVCFAHGEDTEADTPKTWYDCVWVLASKLNHDIKAITGQADDIYLLNYQLAYTDIYDHYSNHALATLELSLCDDPAPEEYTLDVIAAAQLPSGYSLIDRKQIQIGPIMCALSYAGDHDHVHASSKSYQAMAAQFGLQMKRCLYDRTPIKPIHVLSHNIRAWNNGKYIVTLKMYAPVKPLVLDTTGGEVYSPRADSPYYGFELKNGSDQNIIESVELLRGEEIKIVTTEDPTGLTLWYAHDGWDTGGNLRDSQPVTYSDHTIGEYNVYNWCPKFRMTI